MRIAYHLTAPRPPDPVLDAAVQEVERLRTRFGGDVRFLYPARRFRRWLPRRWLPAATVRTLQAVDGQVDLHHVVSDRLRTYRAFERLRRPVIVRLLTPPLEGDADRPSTRRLGAVVVSSEVDAARLRSWGVERPTVIPPPIELERFRAVAPPPDEGPFTLLMGSAPWTRRQFASKGIDALIDVVERTADLRLVLLWRGAQEAAIDRRLRRSAAADRIDCLRRRVEVETVLARCHAAVLPVANDRVVRAYPHSLLEALAAGRPVLTTRHLRLSEMVADSGCGVVAERAGRRELRRAIESLRTDYATFAAAARRLDLDRFDAGRVGTAYGDLYASLLDGGAVSR